MKKGKISPSVMCVDLMNVERDVKRLEKAGVDYLHVDIMDNHFVPNITLSTDFIKGLRSITSLPLDIHLMIEHPENSLPLYEGCSPEDIICIHYESTQNVQRALDMIHSMGARAGVAVNPGTPVSSLEDLMDDIDMILIMMVNPGFAGQKLVPATLQKIRKARELLHATGHNQILIEVDGNVSYENAVKMHTAGADIYVAGSSSILGDLDRLEEGTKRLRSIIDD